MARKNYPDEFRRQAVDLYESTPGSTVRSIAENLGVQRGTLRHWLEVHGTGKKTAADGTLTRSPLRPKVVVDDRDREESLEARVGPAGGRERPVTHRGGEAVHRAGAPSPGGQVFRWSDALVNRFQFVADHQDTFEVKRLCRLVEVERSSYYAWRAGAPARARRAAADAAPAQRIRAIHDVDDTVGAPRVTAELNDAAAAPERVNHKRVARVMREHGIAGYRKRRRVRTTLPEPADQKVPDLLKRDSPPQPRTGATSATSPTCRPPTAPTFTWPP